MDCKHTATLVHGAIDGALDDARAGRFMRHVAACPACARVLAEQRALSAALRRAAPRFAAPAGLAARIGAALDAEAAATRPAPPPRLPYLRQLSQRLPRARLLPQAWRLAASFAAVALLSAGLAWLALTRTTAPEDGARLAAALVDSHVRALMTGHLMVVASSDQHTVKPWFQGRVEVSPPVTDFVAEGFPLLGGRVDYVDRRSAAVLVYRHRQHVIDVYVWAQPGPSAAPAESAHNGYNTIRWTAAGLAFAAVSDVNRDDLRRLVALIQAQ